MNKRKNCYNHVTTSLKPYGEEVKSAIKGILIYSGFENKPLTEEKLARCC
jgi:hypothetical protein